MTLNIPTRSNPMPYYIGAAPIDPDLIWYVNFENGLYQPFSDTTGTYNGGNYFTIDTDNTLGNYLKCTKNNSNNNYNIQWANSQTYLNQYMTGSNDFSVSFWLRAPNWTSYYNQVVLSWKYSDSYNGLVIYRDGGYSSINFRMKSSSQNFMSNANANVNGNNTWNHWAFVRDSSGGKIYVNGSLDNSTNTYINISNVATHNINIGVHYSWSCNAYFDVTKYRIYKRALTSAEVLNLYNNKM